MFFSQNNFHVLVIHQVGVHLEREDKLLVNSEPDQPISNLCAYI